LHAPAARVYACSGQWTMIEPGDRARGLLPVTWPYLRSDPSGGAWLELLFCHGVPKNSLQELLITLAAEARRHALLRRARVVCF
jgi:hypothetical protein